MLSLFSQTSSRAEALSAALKTLPYILFALGMLELASCTPLTVAGAGTAEGIYATRHRDGAPADIADQIPQHESWCYETAGYPECSSYPEKNANNRLIMVDPASRYPLTARGYHEEVIESQQP